MLLKDFFKYSIPFLLFFILECAYALFVGSAASIANILFSGFICYIVFGILFCITNRLSRTTIISSIIMVLILVVNQIKVLYTQEPFMISDLKFTKDVIGMTSLVLPNLFSMVKGYIIPFIILIILLICIIIFTKKNEIKFTNIKHRIICFVIFLTLFVIFIFPTNFLKNIILKVVYNTDGYKDYNSYTTNLEYYWCYGFIAGIYGSNLNNNISVPKNYDETLLINELKDCEKVNSDKNNLKPNIIVLFSESFFDINKVNEVSFNKNVVYNFNELKKEGKNIQLLSPTYGGMSENVTFELLTGGKNCYFNTGYIPLIHLKNLEKVPSIVKDLKNNGYYSKILFGRDHYNSQTSLIKIGFDEYEDLSDNITLKNFRDELLINKLIEEFENKHTDNPIFYMVETYENHMPYNTSKYSKYDINIIESVLNEYDTNTLLAYSQALYNIDNQLKRVYEYIQNYEEPTIIIYFGDHLPYLYTEKGDNLLNKLSYFNTEDEIENLYRLYNTEALILTNFEFEYDNIPNYMSIELMLPYILNELNIDISSYYDWLIDKSETLKAYNSYLKIDKNGNKYKLDEKNDELDNIISLKEHMQYMLFISNSN